MTFRTQIIAALWAAGGIFTLMLCWMIYTTTPFEMPLPQVIGAIATTSLFWWLTGSLLGRAVDRRLQARVNAIRDKLEEGANLRRRMEKQKILLEQFAARALPMTSAMVEHAGDINTQSLELAQTRQASLSTERLLATTDELSDEIQRMASDAREQTAQADLLLNDLDSLAAQQPQLAEQLQQLAALAKQFNLLALNASIEGTRVLDRTRGIGLLVQEIGELGTRAENMAGALQSHLGQVSDNAVRSSVAAEPLANGMRGLVAGTDTLAVLTDEQWSEIEKLHRGMELAPARDGSSSQRFRLMDSAQMLAEKTSMLKQSIEGLVRSLHATA